MNRIIRNLFSMRIMSLGLFIFLFAIATATFLESIYDLQTAKLMIYNALWFELLLLYLSLCLVVNTFVYNMWSAKKIAMLLFHLSFILILLGAGVTRHFGYEGIMRLPEPDPHTGILRPIDYIYSADPKIRIAIDNKYVEQTLFLSEVVSNRFSVDFHFPEKNKKIKVQLQDFQSKHIDSLVVHDTISNFVLNIVTSGNTYNYLSKGDKLLLGDIPLYFEPPHKQVDGIVLHNISGRIALSSSIPLRYLPMSEMQRIRQSGEDVPDSLYVEIPSDSLVSFNTSTLYYVGEHSFVFKELINHARKMRLPSGRKDVGEDFLTLRIEDGNKLKEVVVSGGQGVIATGEYFEFSGMNYRIEYGSIPIRLPFSVACNQFTLHKYPGSDAPSSYESIVTIQDNRKNTTKTRKIFMNNVMDYDGFRFFQSSYFPDETGTILSVNYDWWGTMISYLGYLLMSVGMLLSLFAPVGRFKELNQKLKKINEQRKKSFSSFLLFGCFFMATFHLNAQNTAQQSEHESVSVALYASQAHADKLAYLMVQDYSGRIVPFHTLCDQLLRKIHRKNVFQDGDHTYNAVQTITSMHMTPEAWLNKKIIYVSKVLQDTLKLTSSYASFMDLINETHDEFKLTKEYQKAHQKLDKEKGEFDKQLIKLVERFQVFSEIQMWQYMKIMPVRNDSTHTWHTPFATPVIDHEQELYTVAISYFQALSKATHSADFSLADAQIKLFIDLQQKTGINIAPTATKIKAEVQYNKMNIFKNVQYAYLFIGFILLIIFFIRILTNAAKKETKIIRGIKTAFHSLIFLVFLYHGTGLILRWYISGHAPWSNGYEAVLFVAWVSVLAGFLFAKKNSVILATTCILAFFMLFVTEMNILDPEITPLVPVLQSYWLMIHVAIITGSYAFLGLGAILGLLNLLLYIFRNKQNGRLLTWNIHELTYVSEMAITIGLFMLTIGTFLGGVWANESWGRYWGWDPKETWALVSILTYAILLHLRFIPSLKSKFLFNIASFWAYSVVLFTFFGVNFYLVGLHSYAQGDGLGEFPFGVIVTIGLFYILSEIAHLQYKRYTSPTNPFDRNLVIKKVIITSGIFLCFYFAFFCLQVIDLHATLHITWQTIALIFSTNLILFIFQNIFPNKTAE